MKGTFYKIYCKGKDKRWIRASVIFVSAFFVTFLVARQILLATLVFGDYPLVKLSSGNMLEEFVFSIWNRAAYGESFPIPQGYLFLYIFNQIACFFRDINVFNFLMNMSFPLSFLAFYLFSKKFCESMWFGLYAATLYIINPITITYLNVGGFMWCLVFLPLSFLFFMDTLEKPTMKNLAKAVAFINLTMWTFPTVSVTFLMVLFLIFTSYLILAPSKPKFVKDTIPKLLFLGLFIILCNGPYLFAQYIYLNSPTYGFDQFSILRDFRFTYKELTIFNFLRFAGNVGSPQASLGYNDPLNINNEIGLIIPLLAFASVFFIKSSQLKRTRIIALLTVTSLLSAFVLILRIIVYSELSWIIRIIPAIWTLRNPFKLQFMLAMCMIPLFTFSTEKIAILCMSFYRKRNLKYAALTLALVFLALSHVFIYNFFVFDGFMGLNKTYGSLEALQPDKNINDIVEDSLNWYVEQNFRGIILPFDHDTELHVQFVNPLLYPGRLGLNSKVVDIINGELKSNSNLVNILRLFSTKYVYVNNEWKDKGFHIIQPQNVADIVESLKKENLLEESNYKYSKFVIEPVLPRLYISNYAIFYSTIETIKFIDDSFFSFEPVFLEIKYNGCQTIAADALHPAPFYSYIWEAPFSESFDTYLLINGNESKSTIYYSLDDVGFQNKTLFVSKEQLVYLDEFRLNAGVHRLLLATDESDSFLKSNMDFYGEGSYNVEGNLVEIENGLLLTQNEYDNFDFNVDFMPIKFGKENWHGPNIYFAWTNSSYIRLIFHSENYVELAKKTPEGYIEGMVVKQASIKSDGWNNLRVIKNNQTLVLYLNGEYLLSFSSSLLNDKGRIGVGSDNSTTCFKDLAVSKQIIAGLWLFPSRNLEEIPITVIEMHPDKYVLQFNQTHDAWVALILNENFDTFWKATLDGMVLGNHLKVNLFANGWFTNVTQGVHKIEIYYKPNAAYQSLIYVSVVVEGALFIIAYFSSIIQKFIWKKNLEKTKVNSSRRMRTF
ncbi:MAG: family 16 glycoside hydrolase [Conexivisphaerales archaeon]